MDGMTKGEKMRAIVLEQFGSVANFRERDVPIDLVRPKDADFVGGYLVQSLGMMPVTWGLNMVRGTTIRGQSLTDALSRYNRSAGIGIDPTSRAALYDMTNQMMQDMNVELAFQIRKTMMPWLTDAAGTPLTGAVKEQSLDAPGTTPATIAAPASSPTEPVTAPSTVIAPKASSSAPDAIFPTGDATDNTGNVTVPATSTVETAAPSPRSPQPGVLKLPGNINPSATPN